MKSNTKQDGIPVELWDTSGDLKYERCWSAFLQGNDEILKSTNEKATETLSQENVVDAIILIYNPESPNHTTEIQTWYENFAINSRRLPAGGSKPPKNKSRPYFMLLEHKKHGSDPNNNAIKNSYNNLPKSLQDGCIAIHTTEFSNLDDVLIKFDNFVKMVATKAA
jgi:hypothetical protein